MNLLGYFLSIIISICIPSSSGNFWATKKVNCGVTTWSDWSPWTAPAPAGFRTRTRVIVRNPRNGGIACPSLTETLSRADATVLRPVPRGQNGLPGRSGRIDGVYHRQMSRGGLGLNDILTLLPRDILFMIDVSGSISRSAWMLTKRKLVDLIQSLCGGIGRGRLNNRIAVITFSSRVVLNFNFKTHWTIGSARRAILRMPQERRMTCTGDAFRYAHRYMFDPDTGIRSATESVKEVLVLTDGHSTCGADLSHEVRRLQVKAFVFVLATGNYGIGGKTEIQSMVSRPMIDHIFALVNFIEFRTMVDAIMQYPDECAPFELT